MPSDKVTIPKPGAIPIVSRQPPLRPHAAPVVVQAKSVGTLPLKTPPVGPGIFRSQPPAGVLQPKTAAAPRPAQVRASTSNTIQAYRRDPWQGTGWDATFRATAQGIIRAEWVRARAYQKGPVSARVAVSGANTFAAYGVLVFRPDNNQTTRVVFGARLSGNPSNAGGKMYADHSVRVTNYNVDCAEYYLIKQARSVLQRVLYRAGYPPRPTLYIYSDHSPCPKCQEDFDKLQEHFPDLELVIMYERRYMAHQEDDVWVIPDAERVVGIVEPEDPTKYTGYARASVEDEADGWKTVAGGR